MEGHIDGGADPLGGGQLLAVISTRIVAIIREHYGRGPMKAKTYALDDLIVVVMRGSGFTPLEKTIMDAGDPDRVVAMRHDLQHLMTQRFTDTIEELTGRTVLAFLSQAHVDPDITIEIFFMDGPLEGFGRCRVCERAPVAASREALELVRAGPRAVLVGRTANHRAPQRGRVGRRPPGARSRGRHQIDVR